MQKKRALLTIALPLLGVLALTGCKFAVLGEVGLACDATGVAEATFDWTPVGDESGIQYLDLSLYDTFPDGLFLGAGPLPSDQGAYSWPGLQPNKIHYWRVNTLIDGVWYTSSTGTFVTQACATAPGSSSLIAEKEDGIYVNNRRITDGLGDDRPAISPDGRTVAFERCSLTDQGGWGPPCNICLVDVEGSNLRCLADNGMEPRWFSSGTVIAFKSLSLGPNAGWASGLALYEVSTGNVTHLPDESSYFGGFGPSPDGRSLLLAWETDHRATVVDLVGDVVAEFNNPAYYAQGWSQDGRVLLTEGIGGYWGWGNLADGSITPGAGCLCGGAEGDTIVFAGNYQSRYPWGYSLCEFMGGS